MARNFRIFTCIHLVEGGLGARACPHRLVVPEFGATARSACLPPRTLYMLSLIDYVRYMVSVSFFHVGA